MSNFHPMNLIFHFTCENKAFLSFEQLGSHIFIFFYTFLLIFVVCIYTFPRASSTFSNLFSLCLPSPRCFENNTSRSVLERRHARSSRLACISAVGWLAGWLLAAGWVLAGWLAGRLGAVWLVATWLACWLVGLLAGQEGSRHRKPTMWDLPHKSNNEIRATANQPSDSCHSKPSLADS